MGQLISYTSVGVEAAASERRSTNGLLDPNPGIVRVDAPLGAMASAPSVTPGTSGGATAISNSVRIDDTDPSFRYFGLPGTTGSVYPNTLYTSPFNYGSAWDGSATYYQLASFGVDFDFYGDKFELAIKGTNSRYRLTVVGLGYDAQAGREDTASDGAEWLILYDFGSVGFRRIRFDFLPEIYFGGINIGPNATIFPPSTPKGPKVAHVGDSFTGGAVNVGNLSTTPDALKRLMGWHDVIPSGAGATGYLNNETTKATYRTRIQKDILAHSPDIVIVHGGINDQGVYTAAQIEAEARLLFAQIKASNPNIVLIVDGPQWKNGSPVAGALAIRDGVRAAAVALADVYIEQIGGVYPYSGTIGNYVNTGWMTGSGYVGATTGSGNADLFTDTDGTHPTQAGHDYRAWRIAGDLAAWIRAGRPRGAVVTDGVVS